eukprot:scaffold97527_cov79-Phaeocystis_antarctica.AAC.5
MMRWRAWRAVAASGGASKRWRVDAAVPQGVCDEVVEVHLGAGTAQGGYKVCTGKRVATIHNRRRASSGNATLHTPQLTVHPVERVRCCGEAALHSRVSFASASKRTFTPGAYPRPAARTLPALLSPLLNQPPVRFSESGSATLSSRRTAPSGEKGAAFLIYVAREAAPRPSRQALGRPGEATSCCPHAGKGNAAFKTSCSALRDPAEVREAHPGLQAEDILQRVPSHNPSRRARVEAAPDEQRLVLRLFLRVLLVRAALHARRRHDQRSQEVPHTLPRDQADRQLQRACTGCRGDRACAGPQLAHGSATRRSVQKQQPHPPTGDLAAAHHLSDLLRLAKHRLVASEHSGLVVEYQMRQLHRRLDELDALPAQDANQAPPVQEQIFADHQHRARRVARRVGARSSERRCARAQQRRGLDGRIMRSPVGLPEREDERVERRRLRLRLLVPAHLGRRRRRTAG